MRASKKGTTNKKESAAKAVFGFSAAFSVLSVFAIIFYIFYASIPAFRQIGVFNFLFGDVWSPTKDFLPASERFGIFPMIVGSVLVTLGSIILGGSIGVFTAVFLAKFCKSRLKGTLSQLINFLAGIPSIVYGFFGLVVLVPLLSQISQSGSGKGLLAASIILGLMILPTVASITRDAIEAVPESYYEGALALGCTNEQAVFKVVLLSAKSGILTALVLGVGRAIGETMAVMMVAGNSALFPTGLFSYMRTLTINMVLEMAYASGLHKDALIATGAVLLTFILLINLSLGLLRRQKKDRNKRIRRLKTSKNRSSETLIFKKRGTLERSLKTASLLSTAVVLFALGSIIVFILFKGLPSISLNFLFGESGNAGMSLRPAFITTGLLILIALSVSLPIGVATAIYLTEYSNKSGRFVKIIRLFVETLQGMPSIIFGFFGMIFFCELLGFGYSILAGGLTLSIIILPTIIRATEESLKSVSDSLREASLALGTGKLRTTLRIVLPSALQGIITSVILSIGRIIGESAALIYTAGAVAYTPQSILDSGASFAVMMWLFASEGLYLNYAYATAAVLLIFAAILNGSIAIIKHKLSKTHTNSKGKTSA